MLASVFIQHRYAGVCPRKYQSFDVAHASTRLNYIKLLRHKGFIQLAQVIIGVHFLQR